MNFSYFYSWCKILTGRDAELEYHIDIKACPIFFAYGNEAMYSWPTIENLIRVQFPTDAWLEEVSKNEKDGGGSKLVAFKGDHWFFKDKKMGQ
jgi:hypothetical protein